MKHARVVFAAILASVAGLWGCDALLSPRDEGMQLVAEELRVSEDVVQWAPYPVARLYARVALVNRRPDPVVVAYGACAMSIQVFRRDADGPERRWNSAGVRIWPGGETLGCILPLYEKELAPGDGLGFQYGTSLSWILADSLPTGRYTVVATLKTENLGAITASLGEVELPESRFPLPEGEYQRSWVRYRVSVHQAESAGADAVATLTVDNEGSTTVRLPADCPLRLLAFTEEEDRETIPLLNPTWVWPRTCGDGDPPVELHPGDERALETTISTGELLADGAPPGHYYLVGVVAADGRRIHMTAGEVTLD